MLDTGLPPSGTLVFSILRTRATQPCPASTQKGLSVLWRAGNGELASHSSPWVMGVEKEGHSSILTSREHHQSL